MDPKVRLRGIYDLQLIQKKSMRLRDYKEKVDKDSSKCTYKNPDKIEEFVRLLVLVQP